MKKFLLPFFLLITPWIAGAQYFSYLSPKDMDIFVQNFDELSDIFAAADYHDQRWIEYERRIVRFSEAMDRFYTTLSNKTADDFVQYKYLYHELMNTETPPPVEAVFKKAGWERNGHKKFWTIACGFAYVQYKSYLENEFTIQNNLEEIYSRYKDVFDHYNVINENDLAIISANLGDFDDPSRFDAEGIVLTYGIGETISLDQNNASQVNSYTNDPRSILAYFYASLLRGDDLWKEVVTPDEDNPDGTVPFDIYFKNINLVKVVIRECELWTHDYNYSVFVYAAIDYEYDNRRFTKEEEATFLLEDGTFKLDIIYSDLLYP